MKRDEMFSELRRLNRERMHMIWQVAKSGDLDVLDGQERRLAELMLEHQDEYFNQFEMADVLGDHQFDPESETDPFLHITFHTIVENQLEAKEPIETYQFYNSMRKQKVSHHNTVHLVGAILAPLILNTLQQRRAFDLEKYKSLLKKCKDKKPEKIMEWLDRDPEW
ncbi:MAG: DUF1841 family protein [Deltaproteobacteria bacterium]|nr:DUF1841 family protein [Deltaproteobacteria bacterium]MBW1794136.1 DUF1841 family protein [Deltaproteobacteria bacterium]MBW2331392.1 DUF1841 family protein [Deltaproteobacteria bacterium]